MIKCYQCTVTKIYKMYSGKYRLKNYLSKNKFRQLLISYLYYHAILHAKSTNLLLILCDE